MEIAKREVTRRRLQCEIRRDHVSAAAGVAEKCRKEVQLRPE